MKAKIIRRGAMTRAGELPIGSVIDHRHAWIHCLPRAGNLPPLAEPADDECRKKAAEGAEKVQSVLAQHKETLRNPPEQLLEDVEAMKMFRQMCRNYQIYNGELDDLIAVADAPEFAFIERPDDEQGAVTPTPPPEE